MVCKLKTQKLLETVTVIAGVKIKKKKEKEEEEEGKSRAGGTWNWENRAWLLLNGEKGDWREMLRFHLGLHFWTKVSIPFYIK